MVKLSGPEDVRGVSLGAGAYDVLRELGRGTTGVVYEAIDRRSGAVVALKVLAAMDAESLFRLKRELRRLAHVEHEALPRLSELASDRGAWFFAMPRVHGMDFLAYAGGGAPLARDRNRALAHDQEWRLRRALAQLVEVLAALHDAAHVHRNVKPSNVLVTPEGRLVLLDTALTIGLGSEGRPAETPTYAAPEQIASHRLTAAVDWYAVGVMLFAALTGGSSPPGDLAELLDATSVGAGSGEWDWGPGVPEDLRSLCAALLAREPGVRPEIDEIRGRLGLPAPARPPLRAVFVDREGDIERLRSAMTRAPRSAARVVVRGEAGVGKSALVERVLAEAPARAIVLPARCHEGAPAPFACAEALVVTLCEYLLGVEASAVDRLRAGGMPNAARVFPALARVPAFAADRAVEEAADPAAVRGAAFRELAALLAALGASRTVIVYVDDLQWADAESLALLRDVLLEPVARCTFVATLRAEVALSRETARLVEKLETIDLARLSPDGAHALWLALGSTPDAATLAGALREAGGHPQHSMELIRAARDGRRVPPAGARPRDLLRARVAERDAVDRRLLALVALAGAPTPEAVIAQAAGLDAADAAMRVAVLSAAHLIATSGAVEARCVAACSHGVREAVLEPLRARDRGALASYQLALGRALLARAPEDDASLFAAVHHLDAARDRLAGDAERRELAELHLAASRRARALTAFDRAGAYATSGIHCLAADALQRAGDRELACSLHMERLAAEHLSGRRDAARATFDVVRSAARSAGDAAAVYVRWLALEAPAHPRDALEAGREILRVLGAPAPDPAGARHLLAERALLRWAQAGRPPASYASAPPLEDPTARRLLEVLAAMLAAADAWDQRDEALLEWIGLRIARLSMTAGIAHQTPLGFAAHAASLAAVPARRPEAAAFGELAVALARRDDRPAVVARAALAYGGFVAPWLASFEASRAGVRGALRAAEKHGDAECARRAHVVLQQLAALEGRAVGDVLDACEHAAGSSWAGSPHDEVTAVYFGYARALRGETGAPVTHDAPGPRGPARAREGDSADPPATAVALHRRALCRAELALLAGEDVARLDRWVAELDRGRGVAPGDPIEVEVWFLRALVAARACGAATAAQRARRLPALARAVRRLDAWARGCPANFEPQALVVRAELLRVVGRHREASDAYERARLSARTYGSPKREAIACELAMDHASSVGDAAAAERRRALAIDAYRRWGATAKACALAARGS
jgi:hypothetical protein